METKFKYRIDFKDPSISSIYFSISEDEKGNFKLLDSINIGREHHRINGSVNSKSLIIDWVKEKLFKHELKGIKNITSDNTV